MRKSQIGTWYAKLRGQSHGRSTGNFLKQGAPMGIQGIYRDSESPDLKKYPHGFMQQTFSMSTSKAVEVGGGNYEAIKSTCHVVMCLLILPGPPTLHCCSQVAIPAQGFSCIKCTCLVLAWHAWTQQVPLPRLPHRPRLTWAETHRSLEEECTLFVFTRKHMSQLLSTCPVPKSQLGISGNVLSSAGFLK